MPASKHRSKAKKRHPVITEEEKFQKQINQQLKQSFALTPIQSIAIDTAKQCEPLKAHLQDPKGYLGIMTKIRRSPNVQSFEEYCNLLYRSRVMTRYQAVEFLYQLQAFRAIESWKRVAQSYVLSASLLNKLLHENPNASCQVNQLSLPFQAFYVDFGDIGSTGQHIGLFVNQRDKAHVDFVLINGPHCNSVSLNHHISIQPPENPQDWHIEHPKFINYLITVVINALSLRDRDPDIVYRYDDNDSHDHTEWLTHVGLANTPIDELPHWTHLIDGRTMLNLA